MTDLNEMWAELERYQPYADKRGFGDAWKRMCEERTDYAAYVAAYAASRSNRADRWLAADAAEYAGDMAAEVAGEWSQLAIKNIRDAISYEKEQT